MNFTYFFRYDLSRKDCVNCSAKLFLEGINFILGLGYVSSVHFPSLLTQNSEYAVIKKYGRGLFLNVKSKYKVNILSFDFFCEDQDKKRTAEQNNYRTMSWSQWKLFVFLTSSAA